MTSATHFCLSPKANGCFCLCSSFASAHLLSLQKACGVGWGLHLSLPGQKQYAGQAGSCLKLSLPLLQRGGSYSVGLWGDQRKGGEEKHIGSSQRGTLPQFSLAVSLYKIIFTFSK